MENRMFLGKRLLSENQADPEVSSLSLPAQLANLEVVTASSFSANQHAPPVFLRVSDFSNTARGLRGAGCPLSERNVRVCCRDFGLRRSRRCAPSLTLSFPPALVKVSLRSLASSDAAALSG